MGHKYVGTDYPRADALEKVTGHALFVADFRAPNMLFGKILRSPYAHARITAVDTSAAEKAPGVKAVLSRNDVADRFNRYGVVVLDQTCVAVDKVRYVGDPVAAVAAVDPFSAEEALSLIKVEYEELKPVFDVEQALAPGAPLIHDVMPVPPPIQHVFNPVPETNICNHFKLRRGDVEKGFADSDDVFEDTYTTESDQHGVLETHACIARVLPGNIIEVLTNNQDPSNLQTQLSMVFKVPQSSIRIVVPYVGGGFGSKIGPKLEPLTVALAWKAGSPVRISLSREEEFLTIARHGTKTRIKTGVRKDGTLVAREMCVYIDTGGYADSGPVVCKNLGFSAGGPYRIPHVRTDSYCIYTNKVPAGAMRGFGVHQMAWAYEQQMDMIAERVGLDPVEIRRRNLLADGEIFHTGQVMEDVDFGRLLDRVVQGTGWESERATRKVSRIKSRGKGLSICLKSTATPSTSNAYLKMSGDGSVSLMCNTVEMGQGARTVFKQIIAEELAIGPESIRVLDPDSNVAPFDTGTYSSRSTFHMGNAVILAAEDLKAQLLDAASVMLETGKSDLEFTGGCIAVKEAPSKSIPLAQAVKGPGVPRGSLAGRGIYQTAGGIDKNTGQGLASFYWMSASGGAEVEVDQETGFVKVVKYVGVVDAGKAINPANIEQQNMSSIVMAMGHTFSERMIYNDRGVLQNGNFVDYKVPTIKDLPGQIVADFVEVPHRAGPYGAKGIGEVMIIPPAPAIANAIYEATGIRFKDLPLTPERILKGLMKLRKEKGLQG